MKITIKNYPLALKSPFAIYCLYWILGLEDGLLTLNESTLKVTSKGRLLVHNICMAFDQYTRHASNTRFSKAI
jgi:oxygen-independent coproporphyrinogen-3 oxidase